MDIFKEVTRWGRVAMGYVKAGAWLLAHPHHNLVILRSRSLIYEGNPEIDWSKEKVQLRIVFIACTDGLKVDGAKHIAHTCYRDADPKYSPPGYL